MSLFGCDCDRGNEPDNVEKECVHSWCSWIDSSSKSTITYKTTNSGYQNINTEERRVESVAQTQTRRCFNCNKVDIIVVSPRDA